MNLGPAGSRPPARSSAPFSRAVVAEVEHVYTPRFLSVFNVEFRRESVTES
jgi:hypothetical protein